ncbi:MAG: hypothetical protein ACP5OG_04240 [Candidatus Nanoarchaeia archaeon]
MGFEYPIENIMNERNYLVSYKILDPLTFPCVIKEEVTITALGEKIKNLWFALSNVPKDHSFDINPNFNYVKNNGSLEEAVTLNASSKEILEFYFKKAGIL